MTSTIEQILKDNIGKSLFYISSLDKYVGLINLIDFSFMFKPIGINRIINEDVINKRVKENEDSYLATEKYYDFGNVELVVIRECNDDILYVIDGQHRIRTMENLKIKYPDRDLIVSVSIYVKDTLEETANYLKHFQNQYPSNDRLFSANQVALEFEKELRVYKEGVHQALLILGVDQGLCGLTSVAATEQLEQHIRTLQDSEFHLLNRTEEINKEILEYKEQKVAIMLKLNAYIAKEQESSVSSASTQAQFKQNKKRSI